MAGSHPQESVVYVHSADLLKQAEKNPRISGRVKVSKCAYHMICSCKCMFQGKVVHSLIGAYGLFSKLK